MPAYGHTRVILRRFVLGLDVYRYSGLVTNCNLGAPLVVPALPAQDPNLKVYVKCVDMGL